MIKIIFFILLIPSFAFGNGSLTLQVGYASDGTSITVEGEEKEGHISLFGDYSYKKTAAGIVERDRGTLGISTSPVLKDKEGNPTKLSFWFYDIIKYRQDTLQYRENSIGGGPQYEIKGCWIFSTGGIYRSQEGSDGEGYYSHRLKGCYGPVKVKFTYQHNFEDSKKYRDELDVETPISEKWYLFYYREKYAEQHGYFDTGIRYKFKW